MPRDFHDFKNKPYIVEYLVPSDDNNEAWDFSWAFYTDAEATAHKHACEKFDIEKCLKYTYCKPIKFRVRYSQLGISH